jgi:hypothetical protein
MNGLFKKHQTEFSVQLIALSLVLFSSHTYLCFYLASEILFFFPLWHIYVFHIALVLILFTFINYRVSTGKDELFNLFVLGMVLKMVLTLVFLLPWFLSKPQQQGFDLANFFVPYFFFLTFEVYSITKLYQKNNDIQKAIKQAE